ncbi:lectin-like domain-containing protein [Winogradskyella alexanderae]|uniref:T9SS type B sorting domain-containing protein n=1 Tax=Winogradskyella alexanderae TaxID=2877123 RepID=A0ABS7XNY6_9FLAO|nr:T9SS type B sorting domain-containing protein [Winogradskyella alexanderae]MCA0131701.1 T9SS type B sorting domain-containing protein [Winogradskyella alexanderae]
MNQSRDKIVYPIYLLSILCFFFGANKLNGQLNAVIAGDAIDQGDNCYTITQDVLNQSGGVWYDNAIDFDEDFSILYQNNFGSKDSNGADGMALVFKSTPAPEIGNSGGGLGYQGISPSLTVEFDTYQNNIPAEGLLADPFFDHIAIMANGNPDHNNPASNLAGPVQASPFSQNIEDGANHEIKIEWIASITTFNVYFDCELRLTLVFDIKNNIFFGDDSVFFGFVGSTGGLSNVHEVCFNSISFVDNLQLQDDFICEGSSIIIDATIPSGVSYTWLPVEGVSNPNSPNPTLSPTVTTTYTVTIADVCGNITEEEFTLSVLPFLDPIFDPIAPICSGDALSPLPTTAINGITGTWSPTLNNNATTTYTFTPDNPCVTQTTLEIQVIPLQFPEFDAISPICAGETLAPLPTTSNDGVNGTWSPALNNLVTTSYTFTPDIGQGCAQEVTLEIEVNPIIDPIFDAVESICQGDTLQALPVTSNNGISGAWSPAINNTVSTTYTFTPSAGECANSATLFIEVVPNEIPLFDVIPPTCEGEILEALPTTSLNGLTGTWSPVLDNTQTTTYTFTPSGDQCASAVDITIEILPNEIPEFDAFGPICPGQFIDELPTTSNNGYTGTWLPEINNFETTTYTFTPNPGQGCVVPTTTEIIVTDPIIPVFDEPGSICNGDTLDDLPVMSLDGIIGTWSPELSNTETTTYTFTPDPNQCAIETTLTIEVIPISELALEVEVISEPFAQNQSVVATVIGGAGNYQYRLDDGSWQEQNSFNNVNGCEEHVIRVREASGCSNVALEEFRILKFPKFFTPNGDEFNPFWNIDCLNDQPGAEVSIFDRYGKLLKVISTQGLGWDGTFNGRPMPTNDYWFRVEYLLADGSQTSFSSHFTLKR